MTRRNRIILLSTSVLVAMLVLVGVVYAANVTIDTFNDVQASQYPDCGTVYPTEGNQVRMQDPPEAPSEACVIQPDAEVVTGANVLGVERDLVVTATSGTNAGLTVDESNDNELTVNSDANCRATAHVQWDGEDGDPHTLDRDGLKGKDLTDSGTNEGILIRCTGSDVESDLTVEVYSNTRVATYTVRVPGAIDTLVDMFMPFDDFNNDTTVFTSTGAVVLYVDGTLDDRLDITLDVFKATTVREYGDLPTDTYGARTLDAYHIPGTLRLGDAVDSEAIPNDSTDTKGDDSDDFDDEDGVVGNTTEWSAGSRGGTLVVKWEGCSGCYINGWIDWNSNGYFTDTVEGAPEHIINNENKSADDANGDPFTFDTPTSLTSTTPVTYFARFRICDTSTGCDDPGTTDMGGLGEIEDYLFEIYPTAVELSAFSASWQGGAVKVVWETALEHDTVGFNVWRSTSERGDYVQVNDDLIPSASPGSTWGGSYVFINQNVTPGTTYYYKLDELEVGGAHNWYGPVIAESPKRVLKIKPVPIKPQPIKPQPVNPRQ